jgi:hypothetical protein
MRRYSFKRIAASWSGGAGRHHHPRGVGKNPAAGEISRMETVAVMEDAPRVRVGIAGGGPYFIVEIVAQTPYVPRTFMPIGLP